MTAESAQVLSPTQAAEAFFEHRNALLASAIAYVTQRLLKGARYIPLRGSTDIPVTDGLLPAVLSHFRAQGWIVNAWNTYSESYPQFLRFDGPEWPPSFPAHELPGPSDQVISDGS